MRTIGNAMLRKYLVSLKENDLAVLFAAVKGAHRGGLHINAATYEIIISKLCAADKYTVAMKVYEEMIAHKVLPVSMTFGRLMEHNLKRDNPAVCHVLFHDMLRYGAKPNTFVYHELIRSMAHYTPSR
uniref:Pentatricopeptide repeat-containing protein n=1 Tax=Lygus hesperus TaxID=30085 RepID=A0A0A9XYJ7_LYGHE